MPYDQYIAKELVKLSKDIREKARYFDLRPTDTSTYNWEQKQTTSEALSEVATKIENIIAKYFIFYGLLQDVDQSILTRQCKRQIKRVLQYEEVRKQTGY